MTASVNALGSCGETGAGGTGSTGVVGAAVVDVGVGPVDVTLEDALAVGCVAVLVVGAAVVVVVEVEVGTCVVGDEVASPAAPTGLVGR